MSVRAVSAARYAGPTRKIAGRKPLLSPPLNDKSFNPNMIEGYDLLVFNLHGNENDTVWYGEDKEPNSIGIRTRVPVITQDHILAADLSGTVVFAVNCYLGDEMSPMKAALWASGVKAILSGDQLNYGGVYKPAGADHLGIAFRWALGMRLTPRLAAVLARLYVRLMVSKGIVKKDTMAFRLEINPSKKYGP